MHAPEFSRCRCAMAHFYRHRGADDDEDVKYGVSAFNKKKHKAKKLKTSSNLTVNKTAFVLVKEFENIRLAQEYINSYKAGYEILDEYQDNKIYSIGKNNLKILIET